MTVNLNCYLLHFASRERKFLQTIFILLDSDTVWSVFVKKKKQKKQDKFNEEH